MKPGRVFALILVLGVVVAVPATVCAQETLIVGTVKDASAAVMPGVTITATMETTGNNFQSMTDGLGTYRITARPGLFRVTAELQGFATVARPGVELLMGQARTLNFEMAVSGVEQAVTVTGETPLLDLTQSKVGGNIDPRQMQELPVQGRDWMSLSVFAPGNRTTNIGGTPTTLSREDNTEFSVNLDGQQVTNNLGYGNQPSYSKDAIAEFQYIANRFDAMQGRSSVVQVNAVTKSGTNTLSGSAGGYFRNDKWNAKDPVLGVVLPYKNRQYSGTLGGPIVKNRLHFFLNTEFEQTPRSTIATTAWPAFNATLSGTDTKRLVGGRLDFEISPRSRLMVRSDIVKRWTPFTSLTSDSPAGAASTDETSHALYAVLTQVLNNTTVNEIKGGNAYWTYDQDFLTKWSHHPAASQGIVTGHPIIRFTGFTVGGNANYPRTGEQNTWSIRDDFTHSYNWRGRHDLKLGGELLWNKVLNTNCYNCMGVIDARGGPIPSNITAILPDPFNADTWNLAALSSITRSYAAGIGTFYYPGTEPKWGVWAQDDWKVSDRLTVNLGLRWDVIWNAFGQQWSLPPWSLPDRPQDLNNIQPRVGFAYELNDKTVLRGGGGLYFADVYASSLVWSYMPTVVAQIQVQNDGRPDFASNPFNGPAPTYEQALQRFCYVKNTPGCLLRNADELPPPADQSKIAQKWQGSVGFQRQIGSNASFEADYVYTHGTNEKFLFGNTNLTYNPATGANYPYSDASRRYNPLWGVIGRASQLGWSNYHGLQTAFTKRFSHNWQAGLTYTLSGWWTGDPLVMSGPSQVTQFPLAKDLGSDYSLGPNDQRHRAVLNGIWQVGGGFQVSGSYFYGSGMRQFTLYGGDLRGMSQGFETIGMRLRPNGTIVERANFVGGSIHRVDSRFQQRVPGTGKARIDAMLEVFNLFDRANYGDYVTDEASPLYGKPIYVNNLAYAPRTVQLGIRLMF